MFKLFIQSFLLCQPVIFFRLVGSDGGSVGAEWTVKPGWRSDISRGTQAGDRGACLLKKSEVDNDLVRPRFAHRVVTLRLGSHRE